ncbi:hypothetical protein [Gordonia aquimaris]|uniref:Uncharacterized protein n=1 Tax=Gordonia aquimaris TaxID=2984863 RepID=A0A9X3D8W0_9ACTN|nr:hypothetical protein [Gordonia aquimaris]MCX2966857.1 hypothetical protein [Gordonia aquimaris]
MGAPPDDRHLIDLEPTVDPLTGAPVYAQRLPDVVDPPQDLAIRGGAIAPSTHAGATQSDSVSLTDDRFASGGGYGDEFPVIENAQDAGEEVRIVGGQFVTGKPREGDATRSVDLTDKRFAAMSATDIAEVRKLANSGAAGRYVEVLRPASDMPEYFSTGSHGMYLHTRPTKYGDQLHAVIERDNSTGLYHAHLWLFQMMQNGRLTNTDLNSWVGEPGVSAHHVHLYPGRNGQGAVLCLSTDSRGGMPSLSSCVVRSAQWAAGMGEVVRGREFPYRQ